MAFQNGDLLAAQRGATVGSGSVDELKAYVNSGIGTVHHVADITARDALAGLDVNDTVHVDDDGDAKWARYQLLTTGPNTFVKITDEDLFSSVGNGANLTYAAAPGGGTVQSDTGTDATIPLVDATNAGLIAPAANATLGNITATAPVNLDNLATTVGTNTTEAAAANTAATNNAAALVTTNAAVALNTADRHAPATLTGAATNNPLTLAGQGFGFSISQLTPLT